MSLIERMQRQHPATTGLKEAAEHIERGFLERVAQSLRDQAPAPGALERAGEMLCRTP